jgi:ketosteroid isomerase-like protein
VHRPVYAPILMLATTLVIGCSPSPRTIAAEGEALMRVSRAWAAAVATGNIDSIVAYWADDAIVLPPDQGAVVGKEAITAFVRQSAALPGFSITWAPEEASISAAGDVGYLIERNAVTFADPTGAIHTQQGKAVTIWRKDKAGKWKCVVDTWNNSPTALVLLPRS